MKMSLRGAGLAALTLLFCSSIAAPARASGLDVSRWADRPGVKLVAVELYATWCKPCMAAVPKWKALHEKYRDRGLRLIVVATQDPKAGCANPGWNPDEVVCDDDGSIARSLGAGDALPAAFLWSWQGEKLVSAGHVEDVEREIEAWMLKAPRVAVESGTIEGKPGISASALRDLVRARVRDSGKLDVIATAEEQAKLDRLKAKSLDARYDERAQCEIGKELPANALLEASITVRNGKPRLHLSLLSAEAGCLVAGTVAEWQASSASAIVAEAVAELLAKVRRETERPAAAGPAAAPARQSISVAVPEIRITSAAGLSELNLAAERLLEKAQDAQDDARASFAVKAEAWCALEKLGGKNPYEKDAAAACARWTRFVADHAAQQQQLASQYEALLGLLQLKRRSDEEKRGALEAFLAAYGSLDDDRARAAATILKAWPLAPEAVASFRDPAGPLKRYTMISHGLYRGSPQQPRLYRSVGPDGARVELALNALGLPQKSVVKGRYPSTTTYEWDASFRLLKSTLQLSSGNFVVTAYQYEGGALLPHSAVETRKDGTTRTRRFERDERGAVLRSISADSTFVYTYGSDGYLKSYKYEGADDFKMECHVTDQGKTITERCKTPDSSIINVRHLDEQGRIARFVSEQGETTYEY